MFLLNKPGQFAQLPYHRKKGKSNEKKFHVIRQAGWPAG